MRRLGALAAVALPLGYLGLRAARRERVEVGFADGSAVTLERGAAADALRAIARRAL